jgi:uncharacterized membrane protein (DUF106 family)
MSDQQAERMIRLLEEIRDGQRLQLERQAQALQQQAELLAQQKERYASLSDRYGNAAQLQGGAQEMLDTSRRLIRRARIVMFISFPLALLLFAFLAWTFLARMIQ